MFLWVYVQGTCNYYSRINETCFALKFIFWLHSIQCFCGYMAKAPMIRSSSVCFFFLFFFCNFILDASTTWLTASTVIHNSTAKPSKSLAIIVVELVGWNFAWSRNWTASVISPLLSSWQNSVYTSCMKCLFFFQRKVGGVEKEKCSQQESKLTDRWVVLWHSPV